MGTQNSFGSDFLLLIFVLLFVGLAIYLALLALKFVREGIKGRQSRYWTMTSGTVQTAQLQSQVTSTRNGLRTSYSPKIEYEYIVTGEHYSSSVIRHGIAYMPNAAAAQRLLDQYPSGSTVQVYYDPVNPDDGVLIQNTTTLTWVLVGSLVLLIVMMLLVALEILGIVFAAPSFR